MNQYSCCQALVHLCQSLDGQVGIPGAASLDNGTAATQQVLIQWNQALVEQMVQSTPSSINHVTFRNSNTSTSSAFHLAIHIVLHPPSYHLSEVLLHFIYPEDFGLDLYSLSQSPGMLFLSSSACPLSAFNSNISTHSRPMCPL